MRGRYPKEPELRQRRNKATSRAILSAVPDMDEPRKRAPILPVGTDWHAMTRRWWKKVFASPMATEYLDADVEALLRLAVVVNDFWKRPKLATFEAINRAQAMFGLTPMDRKRLEWQIEQTKNARKGHKPERPATPEGDARNVLRALA